MSSRYRTRPALLDDLTAVLEVLRENQPEAPSDGSGPGRSRVAPSHRQVETWNRIQSSPDVTVYLAEDGSEAAGTACLSILPNLTYDCRPTAFIEAVVVKYAHRRRGVARTVIEQLLRDARAAGCYKVQLLTHKRHASDGAHDLYSTLGFVPEAEGFRLYLT
jgi:GNAT superfamily N-acetyltransferase